MPVNKNISTFIGCDAEYHESKIVIFGAPFDSTTSYRPGARFGCSAIRNESFGIETYSPYQQKDLTEIKVFDAGDLELVFGNPQKALEQIEKFTSQIIADGKTPAMLGGEHLITLGAVKAIHNKYPEMNIIHLDAHSDCRNEYLGEKMSHASVMRRIWELVGDNKIFQFGIRSGDKEEFEWAKSHIYTELFKIDTLNDIIKKMENVPVYVSIDLDVLDPSILPGTGTPEAGGVDFNTVLNAIIQLSKLNIVGFDINELCPIYDQSGSSTAIACKILREALLAFY